MWPYTEVELKAQITKITQAKAEENKATVEAGGGDAGPMVQESDIANIVSSWTGIPVDKVSSDEAGAVLQHTCM